MTQFMTNTGLANKDAVEQAAKNTGFKVGFSDHPMPKDLWDPEDDDYDPAAYEGVYGSIYTEEVGRDHSPFWNELNRLQDASKLNSG